MITVEKIEELLLVEIETVLNQFDRRYITRDQAAIQILRIIENEKSKSEPRDTGKTD